MIVETSVAEKETPKRLFVPSLTLLVFATGGSAAVLALFLPEIAKTFLGSSDQVAVALASQTGAVNSAAEVAVAFLISLLAVRFRHKSILLLGSVFLIVFSVGGFLAPDFITFQVFFVIEGAGSVVISILSLTLIGDILPFNKKAKAISWVMAGTAMASLVGMPILLLIANSVSWRYVFILFALPTSVISLILGSVGIPSRPREQQSVIGKNSCAESFRLVLSNRSCTFCLIGSIVGNAAMVPLFVLAFYRQQFSLSLDLTVGIALANAALFVVGYVASGRLVNKFGAMPTAVICSLLSGIFIIVFFNMPFLSLALTFNFAHVIFKAFSIPAIMFVVVGQVQKSRGTLMSLESISANVGKAIGVVVGGLLLALFSYQALGIGFGAMTIALAAIYFFLVKQPKET